MLNGELAQKSADIANESSIFFDKGHSSADGEEEASGFAAEVFCDGLAVLGGGHEGVFAENNEGWDREGDGVFSEFEGGDDGFCVGFIGFFEEFT